MLIDLLHRCVRWRFSSLGFESGWLESDLARLHYLVRERPDSKTTLILVHGLGTSSSTWLKILPLLRGSHRIIALDLPGFGFSTVKGTRGFCTLHEHVEALSLLLSHGVDQPVVLLGQSFGGWVSAWYAARNTMRVHHLVLVNTAGIYYPGVEKLRDVFTLNSLEDTRRLLDHLWYRYPWYFKPFARAIYHDLTHRRTNELVDSIEAKDFLVEDLARLEMPVSIIWGKDDRVVSGETVDVLCRLVPRGRPFFIDRCGHVPQLERPKEFAAILNRILENYDVG